MQMLLARVRQLEKEMQGIEADLPLEGRENPGSPRLIVV